VLVTVDLTGPFRGSDALAAGVLTRGELRGPRFRRLFPDVHAPAHLEPSLALRSRAASLVVRGHGVVAGYSAAELLGASCGPADAPAEVLMLPGRQRRPRPDLVVHRDLLLDGECCVRKGVELTGPVRTAYDLARWASSLTEKVVAVDALAHGRFPVDDVRELGRIHLGAYGTRALRTVLEFADPRSESPMETRIRMAVVLAGLEPPHVQWPVEGGRYRLELAYPARLLAVEYDGDEHRTQTRARRDLEREAALVRLGWTVLRFDARTVLHDPAEIVRTVHSRLTARP
jgi:very-short-patch-repair endonuclease